MTGELLCIVDVHGKFSFGLWKAKGKPSYEKKKIYLIFKWFFDKKEVSDVSVQCSKTSQTMILFSTDSWITFKNGFNAVWHVKGIFFTPGGPSHILCTGNPPKHFTLWQWLEELVNKWPSQDVSIVGLVVGTFFYMHKTDIFPNWKVTLSERVVVRISGKWEREVEGIRGWGEREVVTISG